MKVLYHVSLEPVDSFKPRVPKSRVNGEDSAEGRICLSDSIKNCINAMPFGAFPIQTMALFGCSAVIYVYRFEIPCGYEGLKSSSEIQLMVPDAKANHEYWLSGSMNGIRIRQFVFEIPHPSYEPVVLDPNGVVMLRISATGTLKRCKPGKALNTDRFLQLLRAAGMKDGRIRAVEDTISKIGIRETLGVVGMEYAKQNLKMKGGGESAAGSAAGWMPKRK